MTEHLRKLSERVSVALLCLSSVAIVLIALAGAADSLGSSIFSPPILGVFELTELLLVVIIFMAQPHVVLTGSHIQLELFGFEPGSAAGRVRRFTTALLGMLCYGVIVAASWRGFTEAWHIREATAGVYAIPVYPVKLILVIGAALAFLMSLLSFFIVPDEKDQSHFIQEAI